MGGSRGHSRHSRAPQNLAQNNCETNAASTPRAAVQDTVACLLQRNKPDALSDACQAALPAQEEATGLKETFWKDGKRFLEDDELDKLGTEDTEMYERWVARKSKSAGSQKNRDRKCEWMRVGREFGREFGREVGCEVGVNGGG